MADLILAGVKWVENRTWTTRHRGRLYIHASRWDGRKEPTPGKGVTGAILGHVELVDVIDISHLKEDDIDGQDTLILPVAERHGLPTELDNLEHIFGPFCWILVRPVLLPEPVPCKGRLNLWKFDGLPE